MLVLMRMMNTSNYGLNMPEISKERDGTETMIASVPCPENSISRCRAQAEFNDVRGLRDNGCVTTYDLVHANCVYWLDKRNPERGMLHMNFDLSFEDELRSGIILNPSVY